MRILFYLISSLLLLQSCSSSLQNRRGYVKRSSTADEIIDSTKVVAKLMPSDYQWNTEGHFTDVIRKKEYYPPDSILKKYPNPFSPTTHIPFYNPKPESLKAFFCNEDESSCTKIDEGYFKEGPLEWGFQKLDVKGGIYVIKICRADTCSTKRIIFMK